MASYTHCTECDTLMEVNVPNMNKFWLSRAERVSAHDLMIRSFDKLFLVILSSIVITDHAITRLDHYVGDEKVQRFSDNDPHIDTVFCCAKALI